MSSSSAGTSSAPLELSTGVDGVLGAGCRGEVRLGVWNGQHVAVKMFPCGCAPDCTEPLEHAGLVRVIERRVVGEQTMEIRELCHMGEMFDLVAEEGGMQELQAIDWLTQMAATLAHCHGLGAACGQPRPEHVLLGGTDVRPRLLGFSGWQPAADGAPPGHRPLRPVRTLDAPELHGRASASHDERASADVWGLGVLMCFMFTSEPPFRSSALDAACPQFARFRAEGLSALPAVVRAVPRRLHALLQAMLSAEPDRRPAASEVLAALSAAVGSDDAAADSLDADAAADAAADGNGRPRKAARGEPVEAAPAVRASISADGGAAASSSSGSGGGGGGGGMFPPPPMRRGPEEGYVRCLGWERLPFPVALLSRSIGIALDALGVHYAIDPHHHLFDVRIPFKPTAAMPPAGPPLDSNLGLSLGSPSPSLGSMSSHPLGSASPASSVDTAAATATTATAAGAGMGAGAATSRASSSQSSSPRELEVAVQIFADDLSKELHHVDVRRRGGEHWQFQSFYLDFREQLSGQLGLSSYAQLSAYSPVQQKREVASHEPVAAFATRQAASSGGGGGGGGGGGECRTGAAPGGGAAPAAAAGPSRFRRASKDVPAQHMGAYLRGESSPR